MDNKPTIIYLIHKYENLKGVEAKERQIKINNKMYPQCEMIAIQTLNGQFEENKINWTEGSIPLVLNVGLVFNRA